MMFLVGEGPIVISLEVRRLVEQATHQCLARAFARVSAERRADG